MNGLLNRGDDHAVRAAAVLIQDAQIHNLHVGCDALIFRGITARAGCGTRSVAAQDAGDVRAVAIFVRSVGISRHKALAINDARALLIVGIEIGMAVHAAVDYRNADAGAVPASAERDVIVDREIVMVHGAADLAVWGDVGDVGVQRDLREGAGGDGVDCGFHYVQVRDMGAALIRDYLVILVRGAVEILHDHFYG